MGSLEGFKEYLNRQIQIHLQQAAVRGSSLDYEHICNRGSCLLKLIKEYEATLTTTQSKRN